MNTRCFNTHHTLSSIVHTKFKFKYKICISNGVFILHYSFPKLCVYVPHLPIDTNFETNYILYNALCSKHFTQVEVHLHHLFDYVIYHLDISQLLSLLSKNKRMINLSLYIGGLSKAALVGCMGVEISQIYHYETA